MIQAFVITLREGVEAALIVGIALAYLAKIGRSDLRRIVYAALGTAVVASAALAAVLARTKLNEETFEGVVMLLAAVFVVTMIVWMSRAAKRLRGDIESRLDAFASRSSIAGLFAFILLMVLREGVETVLILSAVSLNTSALMSFAGTAAGVAVAIVFGVVFVKGTLHVDLRRFFRLTTVILILVAAQLLVAGLHELSESGVLPSSQKEMALIGPIVKNDVIVLVMILALAGVMTLLEFRRRATVVADAESPAARRMAQWSARRERIWMSAVYVSASLFIVLVTAQFVYAKSAASLSPAIEVTPAEGKVTVSAASVAAGQLQRFACPIGKTPVRFFVYRTADGRNVRVLVDACEICGGAGYFVRGGDVVCKNCDAPINPETVGQPGGCNPIPLRAGISADTVTVAVTDLAARKAIFER